MCFFVPVCQCVMYGRILKLLGTINHHRMKLRLVHFSGHFAQDDTCCCALSLTMLCMEKGRAIIGRGRVCFLYWMTESKCDERHGETFKYVCAKVNPCHLMWCAYNWDIFFFKGKFTAWNLFRFLAITPLWNFEISCIGFYIFASGFL